MSPRSWIAYECQSCGYVSLSRPEGRPCVRCLQAFPGAFEVVPKADLDRYREALVKCATASGADVSGGVPTLPHVDDWAVQEVEQLRSDYDEALREMAWLWKREMPRRETWLMEKRGLSKEEAQRLAAQLCPKCGQDHAWCDPTDPCKEAWAREQGPPRPSDGDLRLEEGGS